MKNSNSCIHTARAREGDGEGKKSNRFQLLEINNKVPMIHHKTSASTHFPLGNLFSPTHHQGQRMNVKRDRDRIAENKTTTMKRKTKMRTATQIDVSQSSKIPITRTHITQLTSTYFFSLLVVFFSSFISLISVLSLSFELS